MIVANRHVLLDMLEVHNSSHKNHYPATRRDDSVYDNFRGGLPIVGRSFSITVSSRQLRRA
jgi:hypothetical protein